ncbi:MAG TPA: hypothetical protein VK559_02200 [Ferruginibacter sp.]|nr:hypothetical protein [Ferruginibacter sp.]
MPAITLVFVHGWSVTNLNTYGNLPARLRDEGAKNGININIEEIFLGRYISFHDEVRLPDISRAFDTALADQLGGATNFICITHSTGGPVIRNWWNTYCRSAASKFTMSHLIMLAPANYGSALAKLGKETIGHLKSWVDGIEPGQGVLDWLALGSAEAWNLNADWILNGGDQIGPTKFFPFVLTGQSIDRAFYDSLNSYTGETGSDGVVRVAAANLQATYIKLEQPVPTKNKNGILISAELQLTKSALAPNTPLRIISRRSHSGTTMGIMASVQTGDAPSMETVNAIFDCIKVNTIADYTQLITKFETETIAVQQQEKVEVEKTLFPSERTFIHDRYSMVIFRVTDSEGFPVNDYDLLLTAGAANDFNHLPQGFFVDRQQNNNNNNTITYFLNYDILNGDAEVMNAGKVIREQIPGTDMLGLQLKPRPGSGFFVRYVDCQFTASKTLFDQILNPNSTTMIDIVLQRVVDKEVFRMEGLVSELDFKNTLPSNDIVE